MPNEKSLSGTEQRKENYDYSLTIDESAAGNIEIDYVIKGNEHEAEQLWMEITQLLKEHDEEFGDRSPDTDTDRSGDSNV